MNLRLATSIVMVASLLVVGSQAYRIRKIERDYAALMAEYNSRTSWGSFGVAMMKSFVDGLTLGETGEEGMFTESKRWQRLNSDFAGRHNELSTARSHAIKLRNWGLVFLVASIVVLVACNLKSSNPLEGEPD